MLKDIDRRTFITSATGLGLTLLSGAELVGCAAKNSDSTKQKGSAVDSATASTTTDAAKSAAGGQTGTPPVYFTRSITPAGLIGVYEKLGFVPQGKVAVKISTGEAGGHNFLSADLIADLVHKVDGTIVECNTAYNGKRGHTAEHLRTAREHGFMAIADVDIMDADGQISLPVAQGKHLNEDIVGSHFTKYGSFISLAHFKRHAMGGFGGAVKNCSIGIASSDGKRLIHSAGETKDRTQWGTPHDDFLESMAEAATAVAHKLGPNIVYINVMNKLSVDCDCSSHPADPDMADIGILASTDPVALDQACVDLVYAASDGASVIERIESRNGVHTLDYAETLGLGSKKYKLIEVG